MGPHGCPKSRLLCSIYCTILRNNTKKFPKYHQTVELPGKGGLHNVVFGQVIGIHIKDEFITDDGIVDTLKMKVIARLGYNDYTLVEKTFSIVDFKDKGKMTKSWR